MGIAWGALHYGHGFRELAEHSVHLKTRVVNDSRYGCISLDIREAKKSPLLGVSLFIWFTMTFALVGIQLNVSPMEYLDTRVSLSSFALNVAS